MIWSGFVLHPTWEHDGFGPFRFERAQDDETVSAAARELGR